MRIREETDAGKPTVAPTLRAAFPISTGDTSSARTAKLSLQKKDFSAKFPNIGIQNT